MPEVNPIERLRRIWTPGREIEEVVAQLGPQTELDSLMRDFLHRTIQQKGPVTLDIGSLVDPVMNTGVLRWETIFGPGLEDYPEKRRRQVSLWVEEDECM
ncbi:MAG TPA: hypothetical protein VGE97_05100 [Nitrososphaera sp.]|jgi:hypothetical protein